MRHFFETACSFSAVVAIEGMNDDGGSGEGGAALLSTEERRAPGESPPAPLTIAAEDELEGKQPHMQVRSHDSRAVTEDSLPPPPVSPPPVPSASAAVPSSSEWTSSRRSGRRPVAADTPTTAMKLHGDSSATTAVIADANTPDKYKDGEEEGGDEMTHGGHSLSEGNEELAASMLEIVQKIESELSQTDNPLQQQQQQLPPPPSSLPPRHVASQSVSRDGGDGRDSTAEPRIESQQQLAPYPEESAPASDASIHNVSAAEEESPPDIGIVAEDGGEDKEKDIPEETQAPSTPSPHREETLTSVPPVGMSDSAPSRDAVSSPKYTFMTEMYEPQDPGSTDEPAAPATAVDALESGLLDDQDTSFVLPPASAETENGWISCATETGVPYYYNPQTQESRWTPPASWMQADSDSTVAANTDSSRSEPSATYSNDALFDAAAGVEPFASQLEAMLETTGMRAHDMNMAGLTPLHVACQYGNLPAATLLLYYGANADGVANSNPGTLQVAPSPLFLACRHNHTELIQLLINYGAPLTSTDEEGNSVLHASIASQSPDALLYLLDVVTSGSDGSLLNQCNREDETPLHLAVKLGYVDAVRALLRYGASTDIEDAQGRTPLVQSIMENQVECVQLLQMTLDANPSKRASSSSAPPPVPIALQSDDGSRLGSLQSYIFRLLSLTNAAEEGSELSNAVFQYFDQTQQQISALTAALQVLLAVLVTVLSVGLWFMQAQRLR